MNTRETIERENGNGNDMREKETLGKNERRLNERKTR